MLIECSRSLYQHIGELTDGPTAGYSPMFSWVGTQFYTTNLGNCMLLTNKATGFCVIAPITYKDWSFDTSVILEAIKVAMTVHGYEPKQVDRYLEEGKNVCTTAGADTKIVSRLNRWLKDRAIENLSVSEIVSYFSNKKVQIDDKRVIPAEQMKEALAKEQVEIVKDMHEVMHLKISLRLPAPYKVYRSFEVPVTASFEKLHEIIQIAFSWDSMHLYEFTVGHSKIGPAKDEKADMFSIFDDPEEILDDEEITLAHLNRGAKKFTYIYDFGDYWEHQISIVKRELRSGTPQVICTGGKGDAPWEDSGGPWGYVHMKEVLQNPEDEEYEEVSEWTEDSFRQEFDQDIINGLLEDILTQPKRWSLF